MTLPASWRFAVRCPRCGSTDAESVEVVLALLDRMRCGACGHEQVCDEHERKEHWNERVTADSSTPDYVLPSVRFEALWQALGARGHARNVYLELRALHDEPHRAYHSARHVCACLRLLDDPAVAALAQCAPEVEAALWFHDAVYDTHASDNEERSARMAEEHLTQAGVAAEVVARVAGFIRATKDHVADSADAQLVIDIDLGILGASPDAFARFEEAIRREYAWVDEAAYAAGRAAVLRRFLERPSIYGTRLFRERYEEHARANIAASLQALART